MRFRHAYSGENLLQQFLLPFVKIDKIKTKKTDFAKKACKVKKKIIDFPPFMLI
jgi:hypothetical protein